MVEFMARNKGEYWVMSHMKFRALSFAAASAFALSGISAPAHAQAQNISFETSEVHFSISAQPLGAALTEFSRQSQIAVLVPNELVSGRRSVAVSGDMTPSQALARLTHGTGLRIRQTPEGGLTLIQEQTTSPTRLGAVDPAAPSAIAEEEIIVTAQKREQRLQDVPIAITAITGEDVERRGASTLLDLQYSIPGLSLLEYGPGQERIQMRGISSANGLPTIGRYLDEMPISVDLQGIGLEVRLLDMERIEVLRGPQGTLYGEGSMGGTIRYLTADPDLTRFGGNFEAQAGAVSDGGTAWRTNASVNLPLVEDRVGLRLVAGYENTGGWIDSEVTGEEDINAAEISQLRGKLLVRFTDTIEGSLLVLHQEHDQDYQNFGIDRESNLSVAEINTQDADLVNGVVRWDLGFAELVNSVGYIEAASETRTDISSAYVPFLTLLYGPGFITSVGLGTDYEFNVWTDEIRLASTPGGVFDWTIGLYGRKLETTATTSTPTAPGDPGFQLIGGAVTTESEAWAAFGELDWHATERLTVALGLRYFNEERTFDGTSISFGVPSTITNAGTFDSLNPRLNVSYEFSPVSMVYFNAAQGFRSGGFNRVAVGTPPTFDPETLWTYEVGAKQQWNDRRIIFEGAIYYNDWKDVQSTFFPPGSPFGYTVNTGHVAGWGVDLSLTARPTDHLTLSATYGWNDLEYQEASAEKNTGDPIDYAVQETWSASIDYRHPVSDGVDGFARLDYQHAGEAAYINRGFGSIIAVDPRDTFNARLGLDFGEFQVSLFADNLTDEDTPIIPGPLGLIQQDLEPTPRVVGVNVRASY
jgi:outer membrane receptor protein involved in Fe transport